MTCCCCMSLLGEWCQIISPRHPLPQPTILLISEARSDFCVSSFLTCVSRIWPSLPRCCCCLNVSKHPLFFPAVFEEFFKRLWSDFHFRTILLLLFPRFVFSLEAVNEDALEFSIVPNASIRAIRLRNLSHSAEPPPMPVFSSSPPLPSPSQLISLAPVLSSSSSLSSELSNESDNNDSPLCPDEGSSKLYLEL